MKIGTKSVLLGAHCFFLHPWFVAWGWFKLHGFKAVYIGANHGFPQTLRWKLGVRGGPQFARFLDPRLWVAFLVHDIGYLGKPNMDGSEGEQHPRVGAKIMGLFFGTAWHDFVLYHSRFLAKQQGRRPSALCMADKMALSVTPWWLYLPMVQLTGEAESYSFHKRRDRATTKYSGDPFNEEETRLASSDRMRDRVRAMQLYTRRWVEAHRSGSEDTWTPNSATTVQL